MNDLYEKYIEFVPTTRLESTSLQSLLFEVVEEFTELLACDTPSAIIMEAGDFFWAYVALKLEIGATISFTYYLHRKNNYEIISEVSGLAKRLIRDYNSIPTDEWVKSLNSALDEMHHMVLKILSDDELKLALCYNMYKLEERRKNGELKSTNRN